MRAIKFRGRDIVNGKWIFGSLEIPSVNRNASSHYIWSYSYGQYQKHEVDPKTVGQYTGIKDKNGVGIYEGDVLYFTPYETHTNDRVVKFEEGQFIGEMVRSKQSKPLKEVVDGVEVTGNIHENPSLLLQ